MTKNKNKKRGGRSNSVNRVFSDSSDRTRGVNSFTITRNSQFASTFTGVTFLTVSPNNAAFGAHMNNQALLHLQYKVHDIEVIVYNTGGSNIAVGFTNAIVQNSQTLTTMSNMQVFNYQPSQLVAKPMKLRLTERDLRGDKARYYTWAAAATDFDTAEKFQGYLYFYQSASNTINIRITSRITFFDPVSYNVTAQHLEHHNQFQVKAGNDPLPIQPAEFGFQQTPVHIFEKLGSLARQLIRVDDSELEEKTDFVDLKHSDRAKTSLPSSMNVTNIDSVPPDDSARQLTTRERELFRMFLKQLKNPLLEVSQSED